MGRREHLEPGAREREVVTGKGGYGGVATLHPRATEDPMTDDRMALVDPPQSGPAATPRLAFLLATIDNTSLVCLTRAEHDGEGLIIGLEPTSSQLEQTDAFDPFRTLTVAGLSFWTRYDN